MRYLFGFIWVLAGLVASPPGASAQAGEEEGNSRLERWHPEAFVDPAAPATERAADGPALQLKLTPAGVDVAQSPPHTVDGYTREEMELRVRRAKIGVGVSTAAVGVGFAMGAGAGMSSLCFSFGGEPCPPPRWVAPVSIGAVLALGGLVTMIVSSVALHRRKGQQDRLKEANHGRPGRVRWDLAESRLVF